MKIALYVRELNIRGGTHKQFLKLANYLKQKGHQVDLFSPVFNLDKTYAGFSEHHVISLRHTSFKKQSKFHKACLFARGFWDAFRLFLKARKHEVAHVHDTGCNFFLLLMRYASKAKVIWQLNDIEPAFYVGNAKGYSKTMPALKKKLAFFWRFFAKQAARAANVITVNVSKNKDRVKEHLNAEAKVVYCGVDFLEKRKALPDFSKTCHIVSTGIFFRYRNYETLLKGVSEFAQTHPGRVVLDLVGETQTDPSYAEEIQVLSKTLDNIEVRMHGAVSQETLEALYAQAMAFAFVNVDQSWGLSVFEAASKGLPVILSESVGAVELLAEKPGVLIVEPLSSKAIANALSKVATSQDYAALCAQAHAAVSAMSWDAMYSENIEQLFLEQDSA